MSALFSKFLSKPSIKSTPELKLVKSEEQFSEIELIEKYFIEMSQLFHPIQVKINYDVNQFKNLELGAIAKLFDNEMKKIVGLSYKIKENKLHLNLFNINFDLLLIDNSLQSIFRFELKSNSLQWSILFTKNVLDWFKANYKDVLVIQSEFQGRSTREKESYLLKFEERINLIESYINQSQNDQFFGGLN